MGRLLRWLPVAVARAVLPEPPFECDNARCRVRPRGTIYAAARVCAPGNYTCASCCDPDPNCRCGAGAAGHATAPTANATAVRLHLRAAFPDRAAQLAALSDARAVEAFKGLAWRTPRCPAGYYECAGCCDRDADCACDGACDLGADADCALAYGAGGAKPDGWCPVGYIGCSSPDGWDNDCCSWGAPPPDWAWGSLGFGPNPYMHGACSGDAGVGVPVPPQDYPEDTWQNKKESEQAHIDFTSRWLSRCLRAAGAVTREWCGAGPRELGGWDEFLPDFECSVRKAATNPGAGACCAGPNETAACADGYTVVEGDAPCVFTCCEGAVDDLTTAVDVDAQGFCWEAHANAGRRPLEWRDCCEVPPSRPRAARYWQVRPACAGGRNRTTVYLPRQIAQKRGNRRGKKSQVTKDLEDWFSAESCCARADAPAACFAPDNRTDCDRAACRNFKPGSLSRNEWKVEVNVQALVRTLEGRPGDGIMEVGGDEDDCRGKYTYHKHWDDYKEKNVFVGASPPEARYCADDRTPAGVDVVPGVGTCCLNASDDASCVAKTAACFHGSGPRRCDVLLKYFGSFDRRTWDERGYWDTHWNEKSYPSVFAADGDLVRARPCDFRGEPYACDDLRCDPASGALYYVREDSWRWWDLLPRLRAVLGDEGFCKRNWWRPDLRRTKPWPASARNRRRGERQRIKACGVVTEDGDFFHAQLRAWKRWDEAWLYKTDYNTRGRTEWDHPWENFWASTRAPRKFAGLDAAPAAASADACARAAAREFHRGCRDVCGKTCAELGHDPATFARLRRAVKAWPARGGGDEIPDVCGFAPATGVHLFRPIWVTWGQGLTLVGLVGIWVLGIVLACCVSQPSCRGYARLQLCRNWVIAKLKDGTVLRWCVFVCCGGWVFELVTRPVALLFAGLEFCRLLRRPGEARARYEKFCERRPWFRRHVVPRVEKLSAGVAALFGRHVAPRVESLKKKQAVAALLAKLSVAAPLVWKGLKKAWKGLKKVTARLSRCLGRCLYYCCCCYVWRRLCCCCTRAASCLVKRPPAAVYTAEDGTEQTVPWVVAPGPPGTIVARPDGVKVRVPPGVRRGQLFSLAEAVPVDGGGAAPKHAAEPPSLMERTVLLARKAWVVKKRTLGALVKQVSVPLLGVGIIWLLYDIKERNKKKQSTGASATGAPTPVDGGGAASRERTTFDTNHGDLELFAFQYLFVPWVQEVASALVGDVAAGTREATRAAGGADAAYWLASFFIEGVAIGGGVSVAIAAFAAPGLFRRAGKSFEVAAFLELFALHWLFLLALTLQTFVVVTCLLRSQIAAAGLPPLLHAALHGCYFAWYPLRAWNRHGHNRLKTHWTLRARPRAHFAGAAFLPQFAYDLLVDSFSPTGKRAGWRCRLVADGFVGERYPCRACWKECWDEAPGPPLEPFEQYLASQSLMPAPCADEHLMCEDVWPFWYEKTEDRGWRPESSWTAGVYCMLMLSVALWAALLWYVIQVSTSASRGKGKDLLFCIRKAYWRPPPPDEVEEKAPLVDHEEWFENDKDNDAPVQVRGLRKVFGKKVAVSDATFAIRDSEIFCLLGHNGAGKTTTMSMMTGAMAPDGGSASFFGIRTLGPLADADGLDRLRQLLGFCPQHDALFAHLTLREHLIFYSRLKGVEEARAEHEATGLLELFRLTEMAEGFPLKLSGGQKRKVMMAAALTGGSRLVVLDEPTAGMDPVARREVWTLLRDVRVDRSVLLTTHHMEEAEALADRVAIMAAGSVKCCGTLSFLKRHFGGADDAAAAERKAKREAEAAAKIAEAEAAGDIRAAEKIAEALAEAERADAAAAPAVDLGGGLHVAVTTAVAARDELKAVFAQHVPEAKLAAASKLAEDLRRATETDAANPLLGSTQKSFSSSFKSPLLNATRGASFSASRNWADAGAPLLEDAADDATTTYTVPAAVGRARMVALFEGLEEKADGLGLVDLSVTATSLEDVFISVGEQVEGAAAPVEAKTLLGGALVPARPGEPVPPARLVVAVAQFRLQQIANDLRWIPDLVFGCRVLPGGLRQAMARARASKDHTTFTVPTRFAVLAAALFSGFIVGCAVGAQTGCWLGLGWGLAAAFPTAVAVLLLAALECGVRYYYFKWSVSAPAAVAGGIVGTVAGLIVWRPLEGGAVGLTSLVATAIALGLEAGLRPYFGSPISVFGAIVGLVAGLSAGWGVGWQVGKTTHQYTDASIHGARTAGGVAGFFVGLFVEVFLSVFASAFCSAGIHGTTLLLLQVAAAATPLVVRGNMGRKNATGFKGKWAEAYNALVVGVLLGGYVLAAGFIVEPYVRERYRGLRNLLAVSGLDTFTYWLGNWLGDALILVGGAVCVVFMLAAARMAYRKRLCSSAPTYAQLHAAARKGDLDLGPYDATVASMASAFHDRYPGGFEEEDNEWSSESYATLKQWYCGSVWDHSIGAGAWQNATKYVVRRWMVRWPWLWILLPLCSAGIVSFSHFATTTFDHPLVAVGGTPFVIGVYGFAAPGALAALWWAAAVRKDRWLLQDLGCKAAWLASAASPFGNLAVQVCKVAFHPQLKRAGALEASGPGPLSRQPADPPLPGGWAAALFALFHIVLYEGIVIFQDRRALRPLAWVKTRVSKARAAAMPDDVAAERARVAALTGAGDAASAGDALSTDEDDFQIVVDEPEEEAPPSRPPRTRFSAAVRDTIALLRNVPPGDDPYPPPLVRDIKSADRDGLVVSELRKIYPPRFFGGAAVESVQCAAFGVPTGQVFGLLGANGAGKTTTVSMICRSIEPTSGDARVGGRSVLAEFEDAARALGVVNQKNVLWNHLSCRDHLCLFARLRGVDIEGDARDAAEQALAVVGLSDHADKAAGRLSGGMKRKLAVAVALVGGPSVVLLDEPSSGLDPGAQRNLWDLIKVTMKGRAVVLTTHSMGEADLLCDRIGIMVKGTMRCIGTPQDLKERYAAGYEISCRLKTRDDAHVADLVAFAREAFSSPDVDVAAADADVATLELAGVDPRRTPALAFRAFDDDACARLGVVDFSLARATMEKVFLRIVGGGDGLAQSRLGREVAAMLQAEADDDAQRELDAVVFSEATCCGCTRFACFPLCLWNFWWLFLLNGLLIAGRRENPIYDCVDRTPGEPNEKFDFRKCGEKEYYYKAMVSFYYAPVSLALVVQFLFWPVIAPGFCCAMFCLRPRTGWTGSSAVAPG